MHLAFFSIEVRDRSFYNRQNAKAGYTIGFQGHKIISMEYVSFSLSFDPERRPQSVLVAVQKVFPSQKWLLHWQPWSASERPGLIGLRMISEMHIKCTAWERGYLAELTRFNSHPQAANRPTPKPSTARKRKLPTQAATMILRRRT